VQLKEDGPTENKMPLDDDLKIKDDKIVGWFSCLDDECIFTIWKLER